KIVARIRARDPAERRKNPPGKRSRIGPQMPAFSGQVIDEGVIGFGGPRQLILASDRGKKCARIAIFRQEQMIAIVGGHVERGIEVRTAAASGLARSLM